jgi:hypothetical protein
MKNTLITLLVCLFSVFTADAKDKIMVSIEKDTIEIQVGNIGYVFNAKTPEKLDMVRVWKGSDSLLYDLTAVEVDYSRSYSNAPKKGMSPAEAAKKWAEYLKKFETIRKEIEVRVHD